ncbi:hypothetical protein [Croceimicrobium hydrocarbonivorans]|uniref:T9SS type A sorting domain-containing protein n=1 Tax=Croceimicrobium hydrocarbonivorans TaxID=2761580 RepID=A0A7H0VET5_9FLAO|nr:hypothetical protein [Croceimicrobium hydrocarbonivorans]QNR24233.1 hypothetical protein H4K34_17975 [Croceimicrobium hydrocarbonivorans]
MKKTVLTLALALTLGAASAQNDLGINMTSPAAGSTVGPGVAFDFDVTITNVGTQAVTTNDTVVYFPLLNGSLLYTSQGGQQVPIAFSITGTTMNTSDTESRSISFGGLSINNGTAQNVDFCGGVLAFGPNWNNVNESDTTNNTSCQSIMYDPNGGTVGLAENVIFSEGSLTVLDGSYSDGSTFYVNVYNMNSPVAKVSFIDLTGRVVYSQSFQTQGKEVRAEISLNDMPEGILLAVLEVDGKQINAKKIVVE